MSAPHSDDVPKNRLAATHEDLSQPDTGQSILRNLPGTDQPVWAHRMTRSTTDTPPGLQESWENSGTYAPPALELFVDVDPTVPYKFVMWAKADKPGSNMYLELRDQAGGRALQSGGVSNSPPESEHSYLIERYTLPTEWTRRETTVWFHPEVRRVKVHTLYPNHTSGTEREATQYLAGLWLAPAYAPADHTHSIEDVDATGAASLIGSENNALRLLALRADGQTWIRTGSIIEAGHAANKGYVDNRMDTRAAASHTHTSADITNTAHWSNGSAYAGRVMKLGDDGHFSMGADPTHNNHIARKLYVDGQVSNLQSALDGKADRSELDSRAEDLNAYEVDRMMALVRPRGDGAFVAETSDGFEIGHAVTGSETVRYTLPNFAGAPGGYTLPQLDTCFVGSDGTEVPHDDASITYSGAWEVATYGSNVVSRSTDPGDTKVWYAPAGVPSLSVSACLAGGNGGYWKATARAGLEPVVCASLPTAQDEVVAGRLASTALVDNGGTLNPTDRLLDAHGPGSMSNATPTVVRLAEGLSTSLAHTVTLTNTGHGNASSSGHRGYFFGMVAGTINTRVGPLSGQSAWEYAMSVKPVSGGSSVAVGNVHGYDELVSLTPYVDGRSPTLGVGAVARGDHASLVRVSNLRHPSFTGVLGTAKVTYTAVPGDGLWVDRVITWNADVDVGYCYLVMWPNSFRAGKFAGGEPFSLTSYNLSYRVGGKVLTYAAWTPGSPWAAICHVDPVSVDGWKHTELGSVVEDRNVNLNKLYVPMTAAGAVGETDRGFGRVSAGTVWRARSVHRVASAPLADTALRAV